MAFTALLPALRVAGPRVPASEPAEIWLFKLAVARVLVPPDLTPLAWIAGGYVALTLVGGLFSFLDDYLAAWTGERFLLDVRASVFAHLHRVSLDTLDRNRLGDLISRLTSDVQAIETLLLGGLGDGSAALARLLFFGGALFVLSWPLALVSLVVVPFFWWAARRFSRLVKRAAREKRRRSGSPAAVAQGAPANAPPRRSLHREGPRAQRFPAAARPILDAELAATRI